MGNDREKGIAPGGSLPPDNPFPGLRPFGIGDAARYFGRERECLEICERLRATRFLAVTGVSGCGKSSLVQAGLLSRLHRGLLVSRGAAWKFVTFRPGHDPVGNLASALQGLKPEAKEAVRQLLEDGPFGLIDAISAAGLQSEDKVLVVADQFEELFHSPGYGEINRPGEVARQLVNLLLTASEQSRIPIYVVLTMRAEYVGYCSAFPRLAEAINAGLYLVPQMARRQIRDAIEQPIRTAGASISPRLVDTLLNDSSALDDQLPLLQHALMRMWSRAEVIDGARRLDTPVYDDATRLATSLDRHGNEILAGLSKRQVLIAQTLFRSITDIDANRRKVRRPQLLSGVMKAIGTAPSAPVNPSATVEELVHVLDVFRSSECSFVTPLPSELLTPESRIDLMHESLMRQWNTLTKWVEAEGAVSDEIRRLSERARLWLENDRDPSYLFTGKQLANAENLVIGRMGSLEVEFLDACRDQTRREYEERARVWAGRD